MRTFSYQFGTIWRNDSPIIPVQLMSITQIIMIGCNMLLDNIIEEAVDMFIQDVPYPLLSSWRSAGPFCGEAPGGLTGSPKKRLMLVFYSSESIKKGIFRLTGLVKSFTFSTVNASGIDLQAGFFIDRDCEKSHILTTVMGLVMSHDRISGLENIRCPRVRLSL